MNLANAARTLAALLLIPALTLTACGSDNTDPRNGRVTLDESDCLFGDCYELYKVCVGPDLHTIYRSGVSDDDFERTDEDSPECAS